MKFYPRAWAKYEEVKEGHIKLVPPEYNLDALRSDYKSKMESMIFGDCPSFDELMQFIKEVESKLIVIMEMQGKTGLKNIWITWYKYNWFCEWRNY